MSGDQRPRSQHSAGSSDSARFATGSVLAGRYRIVSLLGRGGMGEVYKAEDLKLKQIVALKFLPEAVAMDDAALQRFQDEVRITRQISHPNVCRVYDIGEVDELSFLSMEFIDGEDLSVLLRRIGRLPGEKAAEIARQICAGLAAAHDNGVLHRDLKPANIMIDGRGKARITDFGVAVVANEVLGREATAGTAAYMAPEQLTGREVTRRSDIYSLGLVLYELFTGKRVFDTDNLAELIKLHESSSPTSPSSHIQDIDPVVERVILRCLEKDAAKRPSSALQVAAALPGGDPLAAALAAGETPSPEMVAESGGDGALRPRVAMTLAAAVVLALVTYTIVGSYANWMARLVDENSPEAITHKARDIIVSLGHTDRPADSVGGLEQYGSLRRYFEDKPVAEPWNDFLTVQPGPLFYWYRQSPRPLITEKTMSFGGVTEDDPSPQSVSGMVSVRLDPAGRLRWLLAVPPQVDKGPEGTEAPDWSKLFAAAGIDQAAFTTTESTWTPTTAYDTRAAWTGAFAGHPDIPIRLEAASYRGKIVYFDVIPPWKRPAMIEPWSMSVGQQIGMYSVVVSLIAVVFGALFLARRNLRIGRGDRKGAMRLAAFGFCATVTGWLIGAGRHISLDAVGVFFNSVLSQSLLAGALLWLMYIALEPYVRRRWPHILVSWSRLLSGGLRDPLVGRDMLIGLLFGTIGAVILALEIVVRSRINALPTILTYPNSWFDMRQFFVSITLGNIASGVTVALFILFFIFGLNLLTRRQWVTAVVFVVLLATIESLGSSDPLIRAPFVLVMDTLMVILLFRFGLLAASVLFVIVNLLTTIPITLDPSAWYFSRSALGLALVLALTFYALHTSLGGQKLFEGSLLDDAA